MAFTISYRNYFTALLLILFTLNGAGQSLFFDDYNQDPVNPIVSSGQPAANYTVWTTVSPANDKGGTVIIEDYVPQDGVIKLLSMEHKDIQTGNRVEVSAPLSVYNAPFTPTLNANTKDLEWTFTMKQNRNSSGGTTGFNGVQTGLAVVLAANGSTWGSQQGSSAKGYAVTFFKPTGQMYCASLSRFNGGLSNSTVLIGNKEEDVFSEFKTWITVKVTYSPSSNEWSLYFRDEYSQVTKGDINNANGLKLIGSVADDTYTNIEMSHFGFALNTPSATTSANSNAMFIDDFSVKAIEINTDKYKVNTSVSGEGDVSANPLSEGHSFGSEVVLTATPSEGYIFKNWSGDVKGFLNPTTVVVNADMNVVANFIPVPQELTEPNKLIHFDEKLLEAVKDEIEKGNPFFVGAYNSLISDAEKNMEKDANPVTNKTLLPASGDIHDYYSISPYFWPDPTKPDGLPWIYKDGVVNPASSGYDTDRVRFEDFEKELEQLIFAYYFSDDPKYAFKAMEYMDIWFVDEATKMNPNANYGSARPGSNDGDRVAVLNFVKIQSVITAMQLFENKGILAEKTKVGVNQWIKEWSVWLQTSDKGIAERAAGNNHGTWCDYQLMGLFLYEGDTVKAKALANEYKTNRIAKQIDTQGKQPEEMSRTKTVNYSAMNLWSMTWFAYMAQQVDVDIWNYSTSDGRSIKKAYSFLKPYVLNPESWTLPNISNGGPVNAINTLWRPLFGKAITIFQEELLSLSENTSEYLTNVEKLQFPPREQLFIEEEGKAYITVLIDNTLGSAQKNPYQVNYNLGEMVELTATPVKGYVFSNWTGDVISNENPLNIKLDSTVTVEANFVQGLTFTISNNTINGTVEISPNKDYYKNGDTIICTPSPSVGYRFDSWYAEGGISGNAVPLEIVIDRNIVLTANFSPITYQLNVTTSNGSVLKTPESSEYAFGTEVELTAIPNEGYVFSEWIGDVNSKENPITIKVDSAINVTANFEILSNISQTGTDIIKIYPNPSQSTVCIEMNMAGNKQISIFNLQGQQVWQTNTNLNKVTLIKGRELLPGIYIISISGEKNVREKIVLQ